MTIRRFVPVTILLVASACSSSATSTASPATTTTNEVETSTTLSVTTIVSTAVVSTTVSPPTTAACRFVDGPRGTKIYPGDCDRPGGQGPVRLLQVLLAIAGFPTPQTGIFDAATEATVKAFQAANALEADGLVGPLTWGALPDLQDECCDD